jgi:hypothetical protein
MNGLIEKFEIAVRLRTNSLCHSPCRNGKTRNNGNKNSQWIKTFETKDIKEIAI